MKEEEYFNKIYPPEKIKDLYGAKPPKEYYKRILLRDAYEYVLHKLEVSPGVIPDKIFNIALALLEYSYDKTHVKEYEIMRNEFVRRYGKDLNKETYADCIKDIEINDGTFNKFVRFWVN